MAILRSLRRSFVFAAALFVLMLSVVRAQDPLGDLKNQFLRENDPTRKGKALVKLGNAQFDLARRALDTSDYTMAVELFHDYRDEVRTAVSSLRAVTADPERHPGGFKQLQIHVRKSIRELDQIILSLPEGQRSPFDELRKDLLGSEKELIDLLFPRQPEKIPGGEKRKG